MDVSRAVETKIFLFYKESYIFMSNQFYSNSIFSMSARVS